MRLNYFNPGKEKMAMPNLDGKTVVIPKGVEVRSMHPTKKRYTTQRTQKIKVHHALFGRFVPVREALDEFRERLEGLGCDLSLLEQWKANNSPEYYQMLVQVDEPAVCWPGTGGYWCEVPLSVVKLAEVKGDAATPVLTKQNLEPITQ